MDNRSKGIPALCFFFCYYGIAVLIFAVSSVLGLSKVAFTAPMVLSILVLTGCGFLFAEIVKQFL